MWPGDSSPSRPLHGAVVFISANCWAVQHTLKTRCVGHFSPLCFCCVVRLVCRPACRSVSPRHIAKVGSPCYLCLFGCVLYALWGFILPLRCSAESDGEPEGASGSGGRVSCAVELRGRPLVFVCRCSFPSICTSCDTFLFGCAAGATVTSGSHS